MILRLAFGTVATLAILAAPLDSRAAVTVLGNALAETCSIAALSGRSDQSAMDTCTAALEGGGLKGIDRAGTFVNRGTIKLRRKLYREARADFDVALKIAPHLGEAFINHGASYVAQREFEKGVEYINRGLELGAREPEKAYYNRALAYEGLGMYQNAYYDYRRAVELKPSWMAAQQHLMRFTIERR